MPVKIFPNKYVSSGIEGVTLGPCDVVLQLAFQPSRSTDGSTVMIDVLLSKSVVGTWVYPELDKSDSAGSLVIYRLPDGPVESAARATINVKPPKIKAATTNNYPINESVVKEYAHSFVQVFGFEDHRMFNQLLGGALGAKLTAESRKSVLTPIAEAHKKYLEAHAALVYKTSDAVVLQNDPTLVVDPVREEAIASAMERDPTLVVISHADLTKARELVEHRWNILCSRINAYGLFVFHIPVATAIDYAASVNAVAKRLLCEFENDPPSVFMTWLQSTLEQSLKTSPLL